MLTESKGLKVRLGINATILGYGRPTGVENVATNLINSMSQRSDSLVVWTINSEQLDPRNNRVEMVLQRAGVLRNRTITVIRAFWDQLVFPRLLIKSRADVAFFPVQEGMLFPPVPQVVLFIDLAPLLCPEGVPFLRKLSYLTRVPFILGRCSAIITISHSVKRELLRQYRHINEKKIHVVHLGYDAKRFHLEAHNPLILAKYGISNKKYLLYLGSISRNKNIHNIIVAYSKSTCLDWHLVVAGKVVNRDYREELIDLIKKNNLEQKVKVIDYVSYEDLPALYCGASLFVFPSFYEGFGLPILEAMACGVPVITSNRCSMPEVAGDAAILVDPDNSDQLADSIHAILVDPDLGRNLVDRGLNRVKSFSWDRAGSQILEVCKEVSEGTGSYRH